MESNGERNRILCSQETANLLEESGKSWTKRREYLVFAKGKGNLQTYWIELAKKSSPSRRSESTAMSSSGDDEPVANQMGENNKWVQAGLRPRAKARSQSNTLDKKEERLVTWNTDILCRLLQDVVARNCRNDSIEGDLDGKEYCEGCNADLCPMVIEEVVDIIELPEQEIKISSETHENPLDELDATVVDQVRLYVKAIASMYRQNHFHNFEHVSLRWTLRCFCFQVIHLPPLTQTFLPSFRLLTSR